MPTLTAPAVAKLRPGATRRIIRDAGAQSLYLVIQPSGHKSWLMRFRRPGGKPGKLVLGPVDLSGREHRDDPVIGAPLTLAGARRLATQVLQERARGKDPVADHKAAKVRKRTEVETAAAGTFAALVRRYAEEHGRKNLRKWRYTVKQLGLHYPRENVRGLTTSEPTATPGGLVQRWADRQVKDIDGHDIYSVVDEARRIGCPGIPARVNKPSEARARDLHTALSSFFGWLHRHRMVSLNPAAGVLRPVSAKARDRVLTPDEIVRFWHSCDKISVPFGAVFKLLLLTGCRLNEIGALRREELQGNGGHAHLIHLPATRTKNKKPHIVPLAPLALQIIEAVPRIENCPYLFSTTGRTPISGWNKIKHELDKAMRNVPHFRLHDLRRTAVTGMAELGIRPDVIELCVNHISGHRGGIAGVYNRAEMLPERRAALLRWAQHVQGLVSGKPANVVRLRRK